MAIHSSNTVWKIPWTEEPGRLQSMRPQRVGHNLADDVVPFLLNVFKNTIQLYIYVHLFCTKHVCSVSHSVMPNSLQPHWLYPVRLLCPWNSLGENSGLDCHFLLQGIILTQGLNLGLLHCRQILYHLSHQGSSQSVCNPVHRIVADLWMII